MNLRDIARRMGIQLEGNETKRRIEQLIEQAKTSWNMPSAWKTLQRDSDGKLNSWLVDFDDKRQAGTFNLINILPRAGKGKGASLPFTKDMLDFLRELNKDNKSNWMGKLLNQENTKFLLSENGKGIIYLPAVGGFGGNQVRVIGSYGQYFEIDAIDPYNLPNVDDVRNNPALIHLYTAWNGKRVTYPAGICYFPVFKCEGAAFIEKRLFK